MQINVPFGAICLIIQYLYVRLPFVKTKHSIDFAGCVSIVGAIILLCLSCTWGGSTYAWDSTVIACMIEGAGLLIVIFVLIELRFAVEPIIPMRLVTVRNVAVACVVNFTSGAWDSCLCVCVCVCGADVAGSRCTHRTHTRARRCQRVSNLSLWVHFGRRLLDRQLCFPASVLPIRGRAQRHGVWHR